MSLGKRKDNSTSVFETYGDKLFECFLLQLDRISFRFRELSNAQLNPHHVKSECVAQFFFVLLVESPQIESTTKTHQRRTNFDRSHSRVFPELQTDVQQPKMETNRANDNTGGASPQIVPTRSPYLGYLGTWRLYASIVDRVPVSVAAVLSARFKRCPVGISHI